jgi:effector-binding domain-containing protein
VNLVLKKFRPLTMARLGAVITSFFVAGCSVVGQSGVESAPYELLKAEESQSIEVRNYESMVLVSASMSEKSGYSAFRKLFDYIGGENEGATQISMTAPVFMDKQTSDQSNANKGTEIAMTAPVFMNENTSSPSMSFVMPKDFTLASTPKPTDPDVTLSEIKNYKVAAIEFNGTLSDRNVEKHTKILIDWITKNEYTAIGEPIKAGYNGPLTIPIWRKNEVLIEIE